MDEKPKKILGNRVYSDATLKTWKKEDLIEQIRILEHNWACAEENYKNSVKNSEKLFAEQKAEIERLKAREKIADEDLNNVSNSWADCREENAKLKEEIERLTEENGRLEGYNSGLKYENAELQKQVDKLSK